MLGGLVDRQRTGLPLPLVSLRPLILPRFDHPRDALDLIHPEEVAPALAKADEDLLLGQELAGEVDPVEPIVHAAVPGSSGRLGWEGQAKR